MSKIGAYIGFIGSALAVGGLSALLTMQNMDLYSEINTPPLAPPAILFPIVWTILYILMGISAALVYTGEGSAARKRAALTTYGVSLVFNFAWSIIFFNMRAFLFAFVWLILLLFLIIKTIFDYKELRPVAAYLQIPYAAWVTFAGYLNFAIWILN